jgi:hypothetical protein
MTDIMSWSERQTELQRERRAIDREDRCAMVADTPCTMCGERMYGGQRRSRKFCSDACRQRAHRRRHPELMKRPDAPYRKAKPEQPSRDLYYGLTDEARRRLDEMIADGRFPLSRVF